MEKKIENKGDPIWINDFSQIIRTDRLMDFIPKPTMPYSEKVNAVVRLSIYAGLILSLLHNNYLYIYVPIVVLVTTYLVYTFQSDKTKEDYQNLPRQLDPITENPSLDRYLQQQEESKRDKANCVTTTLQNPFMNLLPADPRDRASSCSSIDNPELANQVEANFNNNLFKDVDDIYNRRHSERQYYTMPNNKAANDQGKFAQWLYGGPPTCKESTSQCISNIENRLNQQSYRFQ
jgi:hypothetical protein